MARDAGEPGYDVVQVCAYCIEKLTSTCRVTMVPYSGRAYANHACNHLVTASGRGQLRSLPLGQLKSYLKAYGLPSPAGVIEKDDIVDAVLAARVCYLACVLLV